MTAIVVVLKGRTGPDDTLESKRVLLTFEGDEMPNVLVRGGKAFVFAEVEAHAPVFHETRFAIVDS